MAAAAAAAAAGGGSGAGGPVPVAVAGAGAGAGVGSLWNPGSWHWETRNYNKWAAEQLTARLAAVVATGAAGSGGKPAVEVKVVKVADMKAEATINIRKGRKIAVVDLTFTVNWEGRATDGSSARVTTGDAKCMDVMQDDADDEFEVRVTLTTAAGGGGGGGAALVDAASRECMRTGGAACVRGAVRAVIAALMEHDAALEAIALDAKRRAAEAAKTAAAVAESGAEKERIAREQAAREAARVEAETARVREAAGSDAALASELAKAAAVAGTGSLWNVGSYHWEEKPLTGWAKERLGELVKGYDIDVPGGAIRVVSVDLTGDASLTIRKGKRLVFFDFKVKAAWEGTLINADGTVTGTGDGELEIPELDQDAGDDYEVRVKAADDGGATDRALLDLFKKHGMRAFRAKIATFVADMKART